MDKLKALEVFCAVAREGSLAGAARKLGLSPPSVTRIMNELEEFIGTPLLLRSTRAIHLTEIGQAYFADAERTLENVQAADDAAQGARLNPKGTLRLTASVLFGGYYISPIIGEYIDLHPDVNVDSSFLDRNVHIIDEGFDVAVRIGKLQDSRLRAIRVGTVRQVVCGSPAYFEEHGIPRHPDDLLDHRIIHFHGSGFMDDTWHFDDGISIKLDARMRFTSLAPIINMARNGYGLARVLSYQIGPQTGDGELRTVLDDFSQREWPIHLVHGEAHGKSAKLQAFLDLAVERLRADPFLN